MTVTIKPKTTLANKRYRITSDRIAPFRAFTSGYTGKPNAVHRFLNFQNLEKQIRDVTVEFQAFEKANQLVSAYDIIQKFRGQLYIFMDSLLNLNEELPEKFYLNIIVR